MKAIQSSIEITYGYLPVFAFLKSDLKLVFFFLNENRKQVEVVLNPVLKPVLVQLSAKIGS